MKNDEYFILFYLLIYIKLISSNINVVQTNNKANVLNDIIIVNNANIVAAGCINNSIKLWSIDNGELLGSINLESKSVVKCLVSSPNGKMLAVTTKRAIQPEKEKPKLSEYTFINMIGCYDLSTQSWIWEKENEISSYNIIFNLNGNKILARERNIHAGIITLNSKTGEVLSKNYKPWKSIRASNSLPLTEVFNKSGRYIVLWQDAFHEWGDQNLFAKLINWIFRTKQYKYIVPERKHRKTNFWCKT